MAEENLWEALKGAADDVRTQEVDRTSRDAPMAVVASAVARWCRFLVVTEQGRILEATTAVRIKTAIDKPSSNLVHTHTQLFISSHTMQSRHLLCCNLLDAED